MSILNEIDKRIQRVKQQLGSIVRRGLIEIATTAEYFVQVSGYEGERNTDIELWQHYGFCSRPPAGTEALYLNPGGRGEGAIVAATSNRTHRPSIGEGDSVLYAAVSGDSQARVDCLAAGDIDLFPGLTANTVNVGGTAVSCVDYLLKGTAFKAAMDTYLVSMAAAKTVWDAAAPSQALGDVITFIDSLNAATTALQSTSSTWLASNGKVC